MIVRFFFTLLLFLSVSLNAVEPQWLRLEYTMSDSLKMAVSYYPPRGEPRGALLILHDRGGEGVWYRDFAGELQARGLAVLLPDLRGHGSSRIEGRRALPEFEVPRICEDLQSPLDLLRSQDGLQDSNWSILAVGESAATGLRLLETEESLDRLFLLSPLGCDSLSPSLPASSRVMMISCEEDEEALQSQTKLYLSLPPDQRRMDFLPCRSRGRSLLLSRDSLRERIRDWFLE
ncbi:MAG: alpha/beta hydrolase [Candidatus Krumholzibacteria bacterium]|jgi:pimeloyl-ACP methyl ester carboxylesterase|nr:alpha/beta hydrolase [Candidatus Krumholzibacteria bacterium]MDP6669527.1 alpha/beta hydrolase [Candidatus Krumholzibacteria bacterium]MDP6796785.1 alpha/beta hydrolase [Candidatus Krumholzibacteria bacterium]MDP7020777.1 alpha/beta hydrolase [Candidatus Krumholzibacteria bacterium]